jgi:alkanesulfonate monooxygenase SsuD/methylene tetrahydromethanopterin reductase-like flavin-dependent oxidoreductase (luciferase family)
MEFYYFGGHMRDSFITRLDKNGFDGVMFTYSPHQGDLFTLIARDIKVTEKIKYLVAIRPYAISAQYICMIKDSLNSINPNRLQINFISGHIKKNEEHYKGIIGDVTDFSHHIDKTNYLVKYIEELNSMGGNQNFAENSTDIPNTKLDYYVSTTNPHTLELAYKYNHKIIMSYRDYKNKAWTLFDLNKSQMWHKDETPMLGLPIDLKNIKTMLSISPVLRKTQEELDALDKSQQSYDTEYFTYDEFNSFISNTKNNNIDQLLLGAASDENLRQIISFVAKYKNINITNP